VIEISPCTRIPTPAPAAKKARDRVLDESEIKHFWDALDSSKMSSLNKMALRFLLVTGQRRGETVMAEWKEFDIKKAWWDIPSHKTKNGMNHRVPLNAMALEILKEIKTNNSDSSDFLFPSHITGKSIDPRATTRALKKVQESIGLDPFTPHDLRRTVATMMTGLGIQRLTVSKLLNHSEGGITRIYDKYTYEDEKRAASKAWERKLKGILYGEKAKVINMKR